MKLFGDDRAFRLKMIPKSCAYLIERLLPGLSGASGSLRSKYVDASIELSKIGTLLPSAMPIASRYSDTLSTEDVKESESG